MDYCLVLHFIAPDPPPGKIQASAEIKEKLKIIKQPPMKSSEPCFSKR